MFVSHYLERKGEGRVNGWMDWVGLGWVGSGVEGV